MFSFFRKNKTKQKKSSSSDKNFKIIIEEIVSLTQQSKGIYFQLPEQQSYKPGQFITLILSIDGKSYRRTYSFFTVPSNKKSGIAVKSVKNGIVSNYLLEQVKVGDELEVLASNGNFVLKEDNIFENYLFIGGGSGITPIFSIISHLLNKQYDTKITLIYANENADSIIFKKELEQFKNNHANFQLIHLLADTKTMEDKAEKGWLTPALLEKTFTQILDKTNTTPATPKSLQNHLSCYLCGPNEMQEIAKKFLKEKNITNLQFELFVSAANEVKDDKPSDNLENTGNAGNAGNVGNVGNKKSHLVQFELEGSKYEIESAENESILETALNQGIDLPFSCQGGVCSACKGFCKSGEIEMVDQEALSEEEIKEGYVLTCVGFAKSDNIIISYDEV